MAGNPYAEFGAVPVSQSAPAPTPASNPYAEFGAIPVTDASANVPRGTYTQDQGWHPLDNLGNELRTDFSLNNLANSPGVQGILGAGDALRNTFADVANLAPGVNIPLAQTGSGTAYDIGKLAGNTGAFIGGGELLDGARAAAEALPSIGNAAAYLGGDSLLQGGARRLLGSATYGAVTDPDNRTGGALLGGALSIIADAMPWIGQKSVQGAQYFMPTKYMQNVLQSLGGGQSLENAAQSVAKGIKDAYDQQTGVASGLYNSVLDSVRDSNLYNAIKKPDPLMSLDPQAGYTGFYRPQSTKFDITAGTDGQYPNLSPDILDSYNADLKDLHNQFLQNPTFQNAHNLQNQLGVEISALSGGIGAPDVATRNAISDLSKARGAIKGDMLSFLRNTDPSLSQQYIDASEYFRDNVAPFRANPNIYGMATGDITNFKPSSLGNVFAAPDKNLDSVLGNLSQDTINKLLYTKLGQRVPSENADAFMRNYKALDQQGLGSYVSPELQSQVNSLRNRMYARNALQFIPGAGLGAAIGGAKGIPEAIAGGGVGLGIGKPIMNYLQARLPLEQIANAILNGASVSYPTVRAVAIPNILNNSGGQ